MRRATGIIALLILIFGAIWLVRNGYDRAGEGSEVASGGSPATETASSSDSGSASGTVPAEETPAAEAPSAEAPPSESGSAGTEAPAAAGSAQEGPSAADSGSASPQSGESAAFAAPSFDIVRVEPSGDTVIAGQAEPGASIEILDGANPLAEAEANERGEWALVLDQPLAPGTHDLAIRTTSPDKSTVTLSDQRVAIAIPEKEGEEPLIVLNTPGAPSEVLQLPEQDVASAPEAPASGPAAGQTQDSAPSAAPDGASSPAPAGEPSSAETQPGAESPAGPSGTTAASPEIASGESAPSTAPASPSEPSASAPPSGEAGASGQAAAPSPSQPEVGAIPQVPDASGPSETAPESPASPPSETETASGQAEAEPKVAVAAVEAETNGDLFIAGTSTSRAPVRVYIDDELVGEAKPSETGTWLVEGKRDLPPGNYTIRADQVEPDTGRVILRSEVPFDREIQVATLEQNAVSVGSGAGGAEVSGDVAGPATVIIKRGDNLWRISRQMYGRGIRYSTIYQANQDQIRNPDLIYPGQVFVLPAGNTNWEN